MTDAFNRFLDSPVQYATAFAIAIVAVGVFIWLIGSPITSIFEVGASFVRQITRELSGKAGQAGTVNALIVFFTFILGFALMIKPKIASFIQGESTESRVYSLLVFITAIVVFLISLRATTESDRMKKMLQPTPRRKAGRK